MPAKSKVVPNGFRIKLGKEKLVKEKSGMNLSQLAALKLSSLKRINRHGQDELALHYFESELMYEQLLLLKATINIDSVLHLKTQLYAGCKAGMVATVLVFQRQTNLALHFSMELKRRSALRKYCYSFLSVLSTITRCRYRLLLSPIQSKQFLLKVLILF